LIQFSLILKVIKKLVIKMKRLEQLLCHSYESCGLPTALPYFSP